jgi:hypothetical protein
MQDGDSVWMSYMMIKGYRDPWMCIKSGCQTRVTLFEGYLNSCSHISPNGLIELFPPNGRRISRLWYREFRAHLFPFEGSTV